MHVRCMLLLLSQDAELIQLGTLQHDMLCLPISDVPLGIYLAAHAPKFEVQTARSNSEQAFCRQVRKVT